MVNNPLIYVAEAGLLLMFLVHVALATQLALENRRAAAADGGCLKSRGEKSPRFGSRSMILTGLLTFVFVVLHLITFKFGTHYEVTYDGVVVRDLHRLVLEKFNQPIYTAWYLFALVVLGVHLSHGVSSFFQTLGLGSVRNKNLKKIGYAFAVLVAGGFISQPIYAILVGVK
jgi:succinate dehydrogenase / fumarate reductase cytochrome b subunit